MRLGCEMAVEQFSKSDKEWRRRMSDLDSDDQEVTWRDFVVDISKAGDGIVPDSVVRAEPRKPDRLMTAEENDAFWRMCDEVAGPGREPDWEEHLKTINESRMRGLREV